MSELSGERGGGGEIGGSEEGKSKSGEGIGEKGRIIGEGERKDEGRRGGD